MLPGDQNEALNFLANPANHGLNEPVLRIDTHGAIVFLAGKDVYKVKRSIAFDYMDFSTLDKRKAACAKEIAVNRSFATDLYIEPLPITRDKQGLHLGGTGEIVEWTVHLRRFDENQTLDKVAATTALEPEVLDRLAAIITEAHERAVRCHDDIAISTFCSMLSSTVRELFASNIFPEPQIRRLNDGLSEQLDSCQPLLVKRSRAGKIRRCHGDLHLRNIVLIKNEPVLFDAIDFDEGIATVDILFDLAFLLMDLWHRQMFAEANRIFNRYLWLVPDVAAELEGLSLLPLFLSLRAAVRAKVAAAQVKLQPELAHLRVEAQAYLDTAVSFLDPCPACLIAIGGLSGSGKTALSTVVAPSFGRAPGAFHLRSDIERKRLFGVAAEQHLPASAYTKDASSHVYNQLTNLAKITLTAKQAVIVDATFIKEAERTSLAIVGQSCAVDFYGFWLNAPLPLLDRRIRSRKGDASDADVDVLRRQTLEAQADTDWVNLDATRSLEHLRDDVLAAAK